MSSHLPQKLIDLLERILLGSGTSTFRENRSLQNLLILTAIKSDRSRLTGVLASLEKYDAAEIAIFALGKELYEEAFFIYKRFGMNALAVRVLIEHLKDLDRAAEFAASCEDPAVLEILDNARVLTATGPHSAGSAFATDRGLSADELSERTWKRLIDSKKYSEAAVLATAATNGLLRTEKTLQHLKQVDSQPGQSSPLLLYMQNLLENVKLNKSESLEYCKELFKQNQKEEVQRCLKANTLQCSEELGDLANEHDSLLSLEIYMRGNCEEKVVNSLIATRKFKEALKASRSCGQKTDFLQVLRRLLRENVERATELALVLTEPEEPETEPPVELDRILEVFNEPAQQFLLLLLRRKERDAPRKSHSFLHSNPTFNPFE